MAKRYIRINNGLGWANKPSTVTQISAGNLNHMDKGIDDLDNAIEAIYSKRVNNVVTTNEDTFLAGPVGKVLQDQVTELNKNLGPFKYYDSINSADVGVRTISLSKQLYNGSTYLLIAAVPNSANSAFIPNLYLLSRQGATLLATPIISSERITSITFSNMVPVVNFAATTYPKIMIYQLIR